MEVDQSDLHYFYPLNRIRIISIHHGYSQAEVKIENNNRKNISPINFLLADCSLHITSAGTSADSHQPCFKTDASGKQPGQRDRHRAVAGDEQHLPGSPDTEPHQYWFDRLHT